MRDTHNDFLFELQTEELPPKALRTLAEALLQNIKQGLRKIELSFDEENSQFFATPRRLAVLIKTLAAKQQDATIERKGPALEAAFDKGGKPTPACAGFARSCGVTPDQLIKIKNDNGAWVGFMQKTVGKTVKELLPTLAEQALAALPIPKRMRWGSSNVEFIRPVHSVIMLYGHEIIDAEILGCKTGRTTSGHRFLCNETLDITHPKDYAGILAKKGSVIADFTQRKEHIRKAAIAAARAKNMRVLISETLLDEVTGLVEYPVAAFGHFDPSFLTVPQEALISAMQDHQRYFPVVDDNKKLLPHFITINNITSDDPQRIVAGNERVLRARLSDAAFFFETDKKIKLADRVDDLKNIIYQAKLGTLYDKSERIAQLALKIAPQLDVDPVLAKRAAMLSKADLTTALVGEFPELQGIAGYYYAKHDGENEAVATALNEQYMPRFSGDALPETMLGAVLALADRIDTLSGIFSIGLLPTGDKDPFGLRRAALGVLRILIEKKINLNLRAFVSEIVWNFMLDRLKPYYQEQHIAPSVFAAVTALSLTDPYDIHCRIQAVQYFKNLPEAESLSVANKRVSNILAKYDSAFTTNTINEKLFEHDSERTLAEKLKQQQQTILALSDAAEYQKVLSELAHLRQPVDHFFDQVLVMVEDKALRENRLLLLKQLRELFLHVADIALLQS